ncbi:MAG: pyridoxal phosphate-dependent aminotransferase [Microbacteriaceae bacterium]|nr:pyridoxal phosphate-dependent aminotransferase [Microbacteriaceae bacterium]
MPSLAPHARTLPLSGIRAVTERAWSYPDAIGLAVGEPGVKVPDHILRAGAEAWLRDDTNYTPNGGIPALREAVSDHMRTARGLEVSPERVVVTSGSSQGVNLLMSMVLSAGDEILIPNPGYTIFTMIPHLMQVRPVGYELRPELGFDPDFEQLEALVTEHTRALLINSPSNPLGSVFSPEVVRRLVEFAQRHDLWVISDECYEAFTYDSGYVSPLAFDTDQRVISSHTLSKTYGLTGARIGWVIVPEDLAPRIASAQECSVSCVNTPAQYAALAALTGPQDEVGQWAAEYRETARQACALLDRQGISYLEPQGAFYLWVDMSFATEGHVHDWALRFLDEQRVAVAPGDAFGTQGEGWIRLCLAVRREDVLTGISRLPRPVEVTAPLSASVEIA